MAVPFRCLSHQHGRKRVTSCESAAGIQTVSEFLPKRRASSANHGFSAPPDGLLLHWTMKRLLADFLLGNLTFTRPAALELSRLCKYFSDDLWPVTRKQICDPPARWSREYYARFPVGRLLESRFNGALYKTPAEGQDFFIYMKCRGSADAIRLVLRHKGIPHAEFFADRSFNCPDISSCFERAGLPATLPYYSDDRCEMTGSRTILMYLAEKTGLSGLSKKEAVHVESLVDFCFAALHILWGADCKCSYPQELNRERARAHYYRDKILPVLHVLCPVVRRTIGAAEESERKEWGLNDIKTYAKTSHSSWITGEFSVADIMVYSTLSSLIREFGDATLLPFTQLRCFMERVEAHSEGILAFRDSEMRF